MRDTEDPPHRVDSVDAVQHLIAQSALAAIDGDRIGAFRLARQASDWAPSRYWYAFGLAQRAAVSNAFANVDDGREHAVHAADIVESLDWSKADRAERLALLVLAEQLCVSDADHAAQMLAAYHRLCRRDGTTGATLLPHGDLVVPLAAYVSGLIHRSRGRSAKGHALIREAHIRYERADNRWRSAVSLIALHENPLSSEPTSDFYRQAAARIIREHFPRSYLAGRIGDGEHGENDPILHSLSPTRRDVLRHLLEGVAPKAIAATKGLAEKTIRHAIFDLESAFSVHSIQELIVACHRRGLSAASWPSEPKGRSGR